MKKEEIKSYLGLSKDSTPERSSRLRAALAFVKAHPGQKVHFKITSDNGWGFRHLRLKENIVAAKIVGVDGNPHSKQGWRYIWIYALAKPVRKTFYRVYWNDGCNDDFSPARFADLKSNPRYYADVVGVQKIRKAVQP